MDFITPPPSPRCEPVCHATPTKKRTSVPCPRKKNNGNSNKSHSAGEKCEIKLTHEINYNIGYGETVREKIEKNEGKTIDKAICVGNKKKPHDIELFFVGCTKSKTIEVKSVVKQISKRPDIPWSSSQLFQTSNSCIRDIYVEHWYKKHLETNVHKDSIKHIFNIKSDIPTYEKWKRYDAIYLKEMTSFTNELKSTIYNNKKLKNIMSNIKNDFTQYFWDIIDVKKMTNQLENEVYAYAKEKFNDKDYWVLIPDSTNWLLGKCSNNNCCYVYTDTDISKLKNDIKLTPYKFKETSGKRIVDPVWKFEGNVSLNEVRLRWQNCIGISNISLKVN